MQQPGFHIKGRTILCLIHPIYFDPFSLHCWNEMQVCNLWNACFSLWLNTNGHLCSGTNMYFMILCIAMYTLCIAACHVFESIYRPHPMECTSTNTHMHTVGVYFGKQVIYSCVPKYTLAEQFMWHSFSEVPAPVKNAQNQHLIVSQWLIYVWLLGVIDLWLLWLVKEATVSSN